MWVRQVSGAHRGEDEYRRECQVEWPSLISLARTKDGVRYQSYKAAVDVG